MTEAVIIALITGICGVIGNAILNAANRKKDIAERARLDEKTANRLATIEKKIDEHNSYADKISEIKIDVAEIKTELKLIREEK